MILRDILPFSNEPLYIIDGSSYIYRGYYAFSNLSRSDGFPTNALFIVLRVALKLLREQKPKHALFVLDGRGPNFRHQAFPAYKAQRLAMPEPLAMQIPAIVEGMELFGFPVLSRQGMEADDIIASLAGAYKDSRPVVIVGSDKDLRQCLDRQVVLWDPSGKDEKLVTLEDFLKDFPAGPASWPDFQALTGDSSDNIPGVPGVGPKTAGEIMTKFPTLEDLRQGLEDLKPAWRAKIEPHMEDLFTYRELTRLRLDQAKDISLEQMTVKPAPRERQERFLVNYELRTLIRELVQNTVPAKESARLSLLDGLPRQPQPLAQTVDIKAIGDLTGREAALVPADQAFSLGTADEEWLVKAEPGDLAKKLAQAVRVDTPSVRDLLSSDQAWWSLPLENFFDLSLAAYLINPEDRLYHWERLRDSLYADPSYNPEEAPPGSQAMACLALAKRLGPRLEQAGLTPLMRDLELPLIPVLVRMEREGIGIDAKAFQAFTAEVNGMLDELTERMYAQAGTTFNLRSSRQLADVLYNRLKLKISGKTPKGVASTSADVLEKLVGQHPLVDSILEYRKLEKLRSTYLEPLPKLADARGRVHTTFNQLATATGRLSSSSPNLQNIPARGELGARMRALFVAGPGHVLASADYSQIELRVLAHFSQDETLLSAFREGVDIHARTAALLFDTPQDKISASQRRQAKTINFGLLYGMGPQKLGREMGLTLPEAKDFMDKYFAKLTGLKDYYQRVVDQAKTNGFVTTLAGRRRLLPDIHSRNTQLEAQAKRQAINTCVQGSAADIIKMAMLSVDADEALKGLKAKLILQIHDELVLEVPEAHGRAAGERLVELMTNVVRLSVPIAADLGVSRDWAGAH